ncbi:tubulin-tyrosine ligase family protein [Babesia ovata]|uniref:Tubulin-tyrosine ligase family protein n=1 Tax=Babesia ovata TaxID=189622 RepID=A0A2H6K880_9APIC|nr:tubulin-tyrosine ligase family protein [Babesia ovata]GBE59190.1 tubulin-tyrosine ligase family protein [Babesia ovata]
MWPPHLYPAINHATTVRQRSSQTTKRSVSVNPARCKQQENAAVRRKSFTCSKDEQVLRSITDIIGFVEDMNTTKKRDISSDDRSTCDSPSAIKDQLPASNLVKLLSARLHELSKLHQYRQAAKSRSVNSVNNNMNAAEIVATHGAANDTALSYCGAGGGPLANGKWHNTGHTQQCYAANMAWPYSAATLYKRPVINISAAKADAALIKEAAKRLRWDTCDVGTGGDIFWFSNCFTERMLKDQSKLLFGVTYKKVTINRFANIQAATRKSLFACLTDIYVRYTEDDPCLYSLATCPKTYLFPKCNKKVLSEMRMGIPMILKPSAGSMGNGIKVVTSPERIPQTIARGDNYICQVYIARPMLLNGRKFDFRLYVVITNIGGGFHALLSTLGIARVCIHPYQLPDSYNCNDKFMHLTNYSINRHHARFQRSADVDDNAGHKRTLRSVLDTLSKTHGINSNDVWEQMVTVSESAVSTLYPTVQLNADHTDAYSFQIMGLDVLLDENGKMWLLEINANPSLQYMYHDNNAVKYDVVDQHVKVSLVEECLKLAHRLRCGSTRKLELQTWIELRVRIPPEIGEVTALFAEYKSKYKEEDIHCDDWLRFCKDNGLTAALQDSIQSQHKNKANNGKIDLQETKKIMKNIFLRTHTRRKVNGFPEFLSHMEAIALFIFRRMKYQDSSHLGAEVETQAQTVDSQNRRRDHHNLRPAACLRKLTSESRMSVTPDISEALEGVSEEDARLIAHLTWLYGGYSMRSRNKSVTPTDDDDESDISPKVTHSKTKVQPAKTERSATNKPSRPKKDEKKTSSRKHEKQQTRSVDDAKIADVTESLAVGNVDTKKKEVDTPLNAAPNGGNSDINSQSTEATETPSGTATDVLNDEYYYGYFLRGKDTMILDRRRPRWANGLTLKDKVNKFFESGVATRTEICDGTPTTLSICNQFELSNHEAMVADVDRVHYYRAAIFWSGYNDSDNEERKSTKYTLAQTDFETDVQNHSSNSEAGAGESVQEDTNSSYPTTRCNSGELSPNSPIKSYCAGKRVLEIGTGPMCVLAMNALNAGAKFVDALEVSTSAARLASKLMAAYGVADKIRVFNCHSKNFFFDAASFFGLKREDYAGMTEVDLPASPPYDMIISEILGDFCSQEGVADVFLDMQRRVFFNKPEYLSKVKSIPTAAATMFVPCVFPDADNVVNKASLHDEMTIFSPTLKMLQSVGLRIDNLPLCEPWQVLEELRFQEWMQPQMCQHFESAFAITSSGPMCGFLIGIDVEIRPHEHFGTRFGHCESWYSNILLYEKEYMVYAGDVVLTRSIANLTNYVSASCLGDKIDVSRPSYSIRSYILSPVNPDDWDVEDNEVFNYTEPFESRPMKCPCIDDAAPEPVTKVTVAALSQLSRDVVNSQCLDAEDWLSNHQWVRIGDDLYKIRIRPPPIIIDYDEQTSASFGQVPSGKRKLPTDPPRRYKLVKPKP